MCVTVPNFAQLGQTVPVMRPFFDFNYGSRPPSWMVYECLDDLRRVFGGLCHCAKFGWNLCSSFDNMQVLIFCLLSL